MTDRSNPQPIEKPCRHLHLTRVVLPMYREEALTYRCEQCRDFMTLDMKSLGKIKVVRP